MKKYFLWVLWLWVVFFGMQSFPISAENCGGYGLGAECPSPCVRASNGYCSEPDEEEKCKNGVKLNTNVPFIGNCIAFGDEKSEGDTTTVNQVTAFPRLMGALMNIVMTASLIIGFVMILAGGVMMTTGGISTENFRMGKKIIIKVGTVLALIGLSGIILKVINPTFFT